MRLDGALDQDIPALSQLGFMETDLLTASAW
jgi:hypothetical protein